MKINKISLKGFRSFSDLNLTPLLPPSGLLGIRGFNRDTGGSSGSGKSSIILALSYAFDCCPFPATVLQSNNTNTPMQVEVEFEGENGVGVIKRGEINSFTYNGKTVKNSAKAVQEAIRNFTGLSTDFVSALSFQNQKEFGFFLTMTDSEKKEFLSQLLGLNELEVEIDKSNKTIKLLEEEKLKLEASKIAIEPFIVKPNPAVLLTDEVLKDYLKDNQDNLLLLNNKLSSQNSLVKKLKEVLDNEQKEFNKNIQNEKDLVLREIEEAQKSRTPPVPEKSQEEKELDVFETECVSRIKKEKENLKALELINTDLNRDINALNIKANEKKRFLIVKSEIEEKIKIASLNKCSQCKQTWVENAEIISTWKKELEIIDGLILECEKIILLIEEKKNVYNLNKIKTEEISKEIHGLVDTHLEINFRLAEMSQKRLSVLEIWKINSEKEDANKKTELANLVDKKRLEWLDISKQRSSEIDTFVEEINKTKEEVNVVQKNILKIQNDIENINVKNKSELIRFSNQNEVYESTLIKLSEISTKISDNTSLLNKELDFVSSLKTFLGSIFDEVLQEISVETNELLKKVPNVANVTLKFSSEKVTQKGKVNQEIRPVIFKNGKETPLKAGLSGGQYTSVDLAVSLGVGIVLSRRTKKTPGWICLDESFEGMDTVVKESCLAMLKEVAKDRLVIIIDHASETKELFDAFIDVESINGISSIIGVK